MSVKRLLSAALIAATALSLSTAALSQQAAPGRGPAAGAPARGAAPAGAPARGGGRAATPAIDITNLPKQNVHVAQGEARGVVIDGVTRFQGLPYAAPPVIDLRWKVPQPAAHWSGVRDAFNPGGGCAAPNEDCLYLNVQKPADAKPGAKLPVMVYIHGGSFTSGAGANYDGTQFVRQGIVVVTINYRLGRAGWFSHPALTKEGQPSNFGLLDQIAALKWVQTNINAFGGDPKKVTIFGESAGAVSVLYLTISPEARGLFVGAISQSGFPRNVPGNRAAVEAYAARASAAAGVTGDGPPAAAALRRLPLSAFPASTGYFDNTRAYPTVDGKSIRYGITEGYDKGDARVPLLIGGNSNDSSLYNMRAAALADVPNRAAMARVFNPAGNKSDDQLINDYWTVMRMTEPNRNLARVYTRAGKPVYLYYFSFEAPGARTQAIRGARHAADIPYAFNSNRAYAGEELSTAQAMNAYWAAFAKYGNPGAAGGVAWPKYNVAADTIMEFGNDGVHTTSKMLDAQLNYFDSNPRQ